MVGKKKSAIMKRRGASRRSRGDRIFDAVNLILITIFFIIMLYPLYFVIIASISDIHQVGLGNVIWRPVGINFDAYRQVLNHSAIWTGYRNSLIYTSLGVIYNLMLLLPLSYALSKKYLWGRGVVTWFFLFTMFFSGGLIPAYILRVIHLNINNTIWVMILGSVSVWNMVVTRTYFMSSIPDELYESAEIDGAGQIKSFFMIALPLAKPIIAVMALFIGVGAWNSFFSAAIYLTRTDMFPLQLVLRSILILNENIPMDSDLVGALAADVEEQVARQHLAMSMRYSTVFIGSAPLLIAYPFVQKYFVKGLMIGSLKG